MKHEMTSFHTMEPNRNVLFQMHLLFVTIYIYGPMYNFLNTTWCCTLLKVPYYHAPISASNKKLFLWTTRDNILLGTDNINYVYRSTDFTSEMQKILMFRMKFENTLDRFSFLLATKFVKRIPSSMQFKFQAARKWNIIICTFTSGQPVSSCHFPASNTRCDRQHFPLFVSAAFLHQTFLLLH